MPRTQQSTSSNNGSACVEICLTIAENHIPGVAQRMQSWIDDVWIPDNREWVRVWKTGVNLEISEAEILKYEDDFLRSPEISFKK